MNKYTIRLYIYFLLYCLACSTSQEKIHDDLFLAVKNNNEKEVIRLLEVINDVNYFDQLNRSPLDYAIKNDNINMVTLLINKGAYVFYNDPQYDDPLITACLTGNFDIIKLLIDRGAEINNKGWFGETPLHAAIQGGKIEAIKFLLKIGANLNVRDIYGWTPLHECIILLGDSLRYNPHVGYTQIAEILVRHGADPNIKSFHDNLTPLEMAKDMLKSMKGLNENQKKELNKMIKYLSFKTLSGL